MNAKDAIDLRNQDYANAVAEVLSTYGGRAFLWELLERCGVLSAGYLANAAELQFREGRREIGARTLTDLERTRGDAWSLLRTEALAREPRYIITDETPEGD